MSKQTFVANTILTAAQMNTLQANDYNQTVSTFTASYTLVAADKGTRVVMNVASANTVTVNTSLFTAGDTLVIQNIGAGVTTVTAGTATVSSAGPLTISQYGSGTLYFTSAGVSLWFPSAGPAASSGLTLVTTATLSGTPFTLSNCFSATYQHYLIFINNMTTALAAGSVRVRLGSSGAHQYNSLYYGTNELWQQLGSSSAANFFEIQSGATNTYAQIWFNSPFLAVETPYWSWSHNGSAQTVDTRGIETTATSFTDLTFSNANARAWSGGTVKVYGYSA